MPSIQDLYAANLLQYYGYPLFSPGPRDGLEESYRMEGFQIGDVGYVNSVGEFNPLFNIRFPLPGRLRNLGFPEHKPIDLGDVYRKQYALPPGHIFMTGVHQEVFVSSPEENYKFTATSEAGAVLIVPFGATLYDLPPDKSILETFRRTTTKYGRLWCKCSGHDTLYLITGMYKTRNFTLSSFNTGHPGGKMLVRPDDGTHKWACAFPAHLCTSPANNSYENQTILIQGFRMTLRWGWLVVVDRVTESPLSISRWTASLFATLFALSQALFQMAFMWQRLDDNIPHITRLLHPSDSINRY